MPQPIRIALIAGYPADAVLPQARIKPRYLGREHPAPWVRSLCGQLCQRPDIALRVFVHSRAVRRIEEGVENGVPFTFVPKYESGRLDPFHGYLPAWMQLKPLIQKFQPDLVQGFGTESANSVVAVRQPQPSVVFVQGIIEKLAPYSAQSRLRLWAARFCERHVIRQANGVIAETGFVARWVQSVNSRAQLAIIPHAVNPEFLKVAPTFEKKRILCIGTLSRIKGPDRVLRAFARCRQQAPAELWIVGDGPLAQSLKHLAAELGISPWVTFCGAGSRQQVLEYLREGCLLAHGARMDSSPNVVTEAHAAGLPVVATRAGGIPDMIADGVDGYLVDPEDIGSMAARMAELVADPAGCKAMGQKGRAKVRALNDPARIAEQYLAFYHTLLRKKHPSTPSGT